MCEVGRGKCKEEVKDGSWMVEELNWCALRHHFCRLNGSIAQWLNGYSMVPSFVSGLAV